MITSLKSGDSTLTFDHAVTVRLDKKVIGQIKLGEDRLWRYYPKGGSAPGEGFPSVEDCQRSLQ